MFVPINDKHISFHTPGHSGEAYRGCDFFSADITELSFSDNLLNATGELKALNAAWAEAYGVPYCLLSTGGATTAIRAALNALPGTVLVVGNAHVSVYNALKARGGVHYTAATLDDAEMLADRKIDLVVATYPDYFGNIPNLTAVKRLAVSHGAKLLVDSAHGSHFAFSDAFPLPATKYADITVYSLHKTLPVLTGGALLCGKPEFKDALTVSQSLVHSTSPSYPVLYSAYLALNEIKSFPHKYQDVFATIEYFSEDLSGSGFTMQKTDDVTRLVVASRYDGEAVASRLEQAGIFAEAAFENKVVFIVTPYNAKYLSYLAICLKQAVDVPLYNDAAAQACAHAHVGVREIDYSNDQYELINLDVAVGRRLYKEIGCYPPSAPSLFYGQALTAVDIDYIKSIKGRAFGLVNGRVCVLK